jgi:hypothetical protein
MAPVTDLLTPANWTSPETAWIDGHRFVAPAGAGFDADNPWHVRFDGLRYAGLAFKEGEKAPRLAAARAADNMKRMINIKLYGKKYSA